MGQPEPENVPAPLACSGDPVSPDRIGPLLEMDPGGDPERTLARDGYLLVRKAMDTDAVLAARNTILRRLAEVGEVAADHARAMPTGLSRRATMYPEPGRFWEEVSNEPDLRRVTDAPELRRLTGRIFDAPTSGFDFVWLRAMAPGRGSPLHVDHPYMNRGTDRLVTCWIPLGPVGIDESPLFVVENSHTFGDIRSRFEGHDVDRDPMRPGHLSDSPMELARSRGVRLLTTAFEPGDVLIFGMFTLHGSFDNASGRGRLRLSVDTRWQPAEDPMDPRFAGPNPPAHGGRGYACLSASNPLTAPPVLR
jgi:hypothetical protein